MSNSFIIEFFAGLLRARAINGSAVTRDGISMPVHSLHGISGGDSGPQAGTVLIHRI